MKIKNSMKMIALLVVVSTLFVGCGGSDDNTSNDNTSVDNTVVAVSPTLTGTFVDAPVKGIRYKTPTQNGFTDESGQFKYKAGEEVEFTLGNLSLGKVVAGALMTPYTISDNNSTAINIALLLQNFDGNRSNREILDLSKLKDFKFTLSDFNLSTPTIDIKGKIDILFADNSFSAFRDDTNSTVLDFEAVKAAMDSYIASHPVKYDKKFTQSYLDNTDFYGVDDFGPLIVHFNNGQLYYAGSSHKDANGSIVKGAGWDGVFKIDGTGVATYTLKDGVITIVYDGGSKVTRKITAVTDTSITVLQKDISDGKTKTTTWYTDKSVAQRNSLISQALNKSGKLYSLKKGNYVESPYTLGFTASKLNTSSVKDGSLSFPYSIIDGYIVADQSSLTKSEAYQGSKNMSKAYYTIISVDSKYIYGCVEYTLLDIKSCNSANYRIQY